MESGEKFLPVISADLKACGLGPVSPPSSEGDRFIVVQGADGKPLAVKCERLDEEEQRGIPVIFADGKIGLVRFDGDDCVCPDTLSVLFDTEGPYGVAIWYEGSSSSVAWGAGSWGSGTVSWYTVPGRRWYGWLRWNGNRFTGKLTEEYSELEWKREDYVFVKGSFFLDTAMDPDSVQYYEISEKDFDLPQHFGGPWEGNYYQPNGCWDPVSNTPELKDDDEHPWGSILCAVNAGSANLGSGVLNFNKGDFVLKWELAQKWVKVPLAEGGSGEAEGKHSFNPTSEACYHQDGGHSYSCDDQPDVTHTWTYNRVGGGTWRWNIFMGSSLIYEPDDPDDFPFWKFDHDAYAFDNQHRSGCLVPMGPFATPRIIPPGSNPQCDHEGYWFAWGETHNTYDYEKVSEDKVTFSIASGWTWGSVTGWYGEQKVNSQKVEMEKIPYECIGYGQHPTANVTSLLLTAESSEDYIRLNGQINLEQAEAGEEKICEWNIEVSQGIPQFSFRDSAWSPFESFDIQDASIVFDDIDKMFRLKVNFGSFEYAGNTINVGEIEFEKGGGWDTKGFYATIGGKAVVVT